MEFTSKITMMKERVYIEVPTDKREEAIKQLGRPIIVAVRPVLNMQTEDLIEQMNTKEGKSLLKGASKKYNR